MRLRTWIVIVTAVAVVAGGVVAWTLTGGSPRQAAGQSAAIAARTHATATPSRPSAGRPSAGRPSAGRPSPSPSPSPTIAVTGAPRGVKAKGAVLADAATGQVLWGRNVDTERPMASITKVMTALLVLQSGDLSRQIKISKAAESYAWKYGGETAALRPGDVLTAQQLLPALLLASGADAAYTLATAYGPGLTAFVARMNATAAQMGMTHTHFASPDGLPYPTETSTYSTPADLLTLGLAAMRYQAFRSVVDLQFYHLPKGKGHHQYWWDNTDGLIGSYAGATGIKDGYTDHAGLCLLFEAVRGNRTLIGVVLDSPANRPLAAMKDAEQLLNWGFGLPRA